MLNCWVLTEKLLQIKKKHLLVENELNKLKTFESNYFIGKSHFAEDGVQNYLVFQPIIRYFKVNTITNTDYVSSWKSKGLSDESIKQPTAYDSSLTPELNLWYQNKVKLNGSYLQQSKILYTDCKHLYRYELGSSGSHNNDPTLKNCLFGAVTLTKIALINLNILVMELDLIEDQAFHFQVEDLVKMY